MKLFNSNIGLEFQRQMTLWFLEYPEVTHQWRSNELIIYHPIDRSQEIHFILDSRSVKIVFNEIRKEFLKKIFKDIRDQVFEIRGYWINNLFDKKDLEIRDSELNNGEIAVIHCNSKYGQILTIDMNIFTGWGEVYKIFNSLDDAKIYCDSIKNEEIETLMYDSNYRFIK